MKIVLIAAACLAVGFFAGFYVSNALNRSAALVASSPTSVPVSAEAPHGASAPSAPGASGPNAAALPGVQEALDKAKNEPQNFDAQIAAGRLFLRIQNFDRAATYFEAAAATRPSDAGALVSLGNGFLDAKKPERAEQYYTEALAKTPNDIGARSDLGVTFVERAAPDYDRAIKEFETALKIDPKHEPTLFNIAYAYFKKGDAASARRYADELEKASPSSPNTAKLKELLK